MKSFCDSHGWAKETRKWSSALTLMDFFRRREPHELLEIFRTTKERVTVSSNLTGILS